MSERDYYNPNITQEEQEELEKNAKLIAQGKLPMRKYYFDKEAYCDMFRYCPDRLTRLKESVQQELNHADSNDVKAILRNKKTYAVFIAIITLAIVYSCIMEALWEEELIIFWFCSFPILFLINWYFVFRKEKKRTWISFRISLPCILACCIIPIAGLSFSYNYEIEIFAMYVSLFIMYIEIGEKFIWKKTEQ